MEGKSQTSVSIVAPTRGQDAMPTRNRIPEPGHPAPPFFEALPAPEAHTAPISEAPPHGPAQRLGETRVSVPFIVQRTRLGKAPG